MANNTERPRLPEPLQEAVAEVQDEGDYATAGEAIRAVFREAGHDV